jgi:hypothetical protein
MTAPATPDGEFTPAARAITDGDGMWSAWLPSGPSRRVEARFAGTGTVEPSTSGTVRITVPASVTLTIHPRSTHWGGTITLGGRLRGCCVPPVGEIVVLRIGWRGGSAEIGHVYTRRSGRFSARYTFLRGNGTQTYRVWATTVAESDYPYAISSSRRVRVKVGPG